MMDTGMHLPNWSETFSAFQTQKFAVSQPHAVSYKQSTQESLMYHNIAVAVRET